MRPLKSFAEMVLGWLWCAGDRDSCKPVHSGSQRCRHRDEMLDHMSVVQRVEQVEDYHQIKMSGRIK